MNLSLFVFLINLDLDYILFGVFSLGITNDTEKIRLEDKRCLVSNYSANSGVG